MANDDHIIINSNRLSDIDPDVNFLSSADCEYFDCDSLKICNTSNIICSRMSLFHVNIRSVTKNIQNLLNYLHTTESQFTVVALTETWLNDSNCSLYNLPGYNNFGLTRCNRIGGGVSIYIKQSFVCKERVEFHACNEHYESLFIEIMQSTGNNTIVGVIYRPPSADPRQFLDYMENTLSRLHTERNGENP